ncbi:trypco2 family protein [Kineococcus gynurae]|uniref:Trypco2 family protein n=1 Tax=Kineococcus gynurae TaxID=452979 RepID=A0ABV5LVX3_9ACTN
MAHDNDSASRGGKVDLAAVVGQLRRQLGDAQDAALTDLATAQAAGRPTVVFEVGDVTVDLDVTITAEASTKASVKFWVVVEAGAEAGVSRASSQRISLTLTPRVVASDGQMQTSPVRVRDLE